LVTRIIFGEEYGLLSCSLCSFVHSPVSSSLLGPNIFLNTLKCSSLNAIQVSRPHKKTGKIIVLYTLTLILLTWSIGWAPNNTSKWRMGFNLAFKWLMLYFLCTFNDLNYLRFGIKCSGIWHCVIGWLRVLLSSSSDCSLQTQAAVAFGTCGTTHQRTHSNIPEGVCSVTLLWEPQILNFCFI
jgi:hypothetical protein